VEHGQLFGEQDGAGKRFVGEFCGGGGIFELGEGFRKKVLGITEFVEEFFSAGEVEEVPVFLFLDDFHKAKTGQLDVEYVGSLTRLETSGFQVIFAGRAGFPEEREADGDVIGAGDDQGAIARGDVGGDGDGLGPDGIGGGGLELREALAVAEDFELHWHCGLNISKAAED
jgi:hypothetical protein